MRGEAPLPDRSEVVALTDTLAIASSRKGKNADGAALASLAGDLRASVYRLDQSATDAREALELYAAAARAAAQTETGCEVDRKRASFAGEAAHDAALGYRELYLASRRSAGLATQAPRSACLESIDRALARAVAYRPAGDAMRALEREGDGAAEASAAERTDAGAPIVLGDAAPASDVAPAATPASAGPASDVVISPKGDAFEKRAVKVTSVERYGEDKGARVVINLSGPTTFAVGTLAADGGAGKDARIFLDVARATSKGVPREMEVGGAVRRVRLGAHEGGTRVVLDLSAYLYRRIFYLPDPFRIVIDVSTRPPMRAETPSATGGREVRRVVIDAGHGGNDTGATGPTGLREKDVTLDIAHRIAPVLAHELKIESLLTRDADAYVPLDARTARANAFHADLFVSIHCNASENGQARGVQTFHLDQVRDPEGAATRLAARENAARGKAGDPIDAAGVDQVNAVLSSLNVADMVARSHHVAELVQRSALASLASRYPDTKDQGVKSAGFFVLVGADMPAVLFETSFISNPEDEVRLGTADYRQKMADAIVNAIRAYRDGK